MENQPGADRPASTLLKFVKDLLNAALSIFILAPLVVGYWRGTFYLLEFYVFPCERPLQDSPLLGSLLFSLTLGIIGGIFFSYAQILLMKHICGMKSPVSELFAKRLYCYIYGIILVNHWRGDENV